MLNVGGGVRLPHVDGTGRNPNMLKWRRFEKDQPESIASGMSGPFAERRSVELTQPVCQRLACRFPNVDDEIVVYPVVVRFLFTTRDDVHAWQILPCSSVRSDHGRQSQNPTSPVMVRPSQRKVSF